MDRVARNLSSEGAGILVPTEQDGPPAQPPQQRAAGDQHIGEGAPRIEQRDDAHEGHDDEQPRDGWIEFQHQRDAEVGDEPEDGAFKNGAQALIAAEQQARIVEPELRERTDEQGHADQEQRQVVRKGGVGYGEAEAG